MMKKYTRGFTLIELLVVIAIIGILASVVLVSLNSARKKGTDTRIISDVNQLRTQFESDTNGSDYSSTFKASAAGQLTITSPSTIGVTALQTLMQDAVTNAPSGYTKVSTLDGSASPLIVPTDPANPGTVLTGGSTVANSVILVVTNGIASVANTYTTKPTTYAIWGRLSTGNYFCIDSTGKTMNGSTVTPASYSVDGSCH